MILILLRILFGAALGWTIYRASEHAQTNLEGGDLMNAWYVAQAVILAVANGLVWAPYFGSKVADPLTSTITSGTHLQFNNRLLRWIRSLDHRGAKRLTRWFCFVEGVRHPTQPTQFVIGFNNAKPGSWLEKVYAREVFKFNNIQNCVAAYRALQRHGIDPGPHPNPEVTVLLMSLDREPRPDPEVLAVPKAAPPAAPARNSSIRLFDGATEKPTVPTTSGEKETS